MIFNGMTEELISIIVPVYNIEAYLPKCLETIAAQTYNNLEIIVIDDGSTDNSGNICDAFAEKDDRAIVIHQFNQGQWMARNTGKTIAHGKYIMFVDGDDYLHLDAVKLLYFAIRQNNDYGLAFANYKVTYQSNEDIINRIDYQQLEWTQYDLMSKLLIDYSVERSLKPVWNKLYKRELIDNYFFQPYPIAEDFDFNIRVFMQIPKAIYIRQVLYFYYQRQNSSMNKLESPRLYDQCRLQLLICNLKNLPTDKTEYRPLLLKKLYRQIAIVKARSMKMGTENTTRELCIECIKETKNMYWKESGINPSEKMAVMLLIRFPSVMRWLMKRTDNY